MRETVSRAISSLSGTYEYYVQLMNDDLPVGEASDIVTAVHG